MRDSGQRSESSGLKLQELADVIDAAVRLADEMANDPVLQRLLEAFRLMPLEDRGTILRAIEREVQARRLSNATQDATGQAMHPNPHARLYLRSHERVVPRNIIERDEIMLAMLSGMRVAPMLLTPDLHKSWVDGTREAIEHLDDAARASVEQLLRETLELLDAVRTAESSDERTARAS
jgi:hypothetical protein